MADVEEPHSDRKPRSHQRRRRRPKHEKGIPRDNYLSMHSQFDGNTLTRTILVNWDKQVVLDITVKGQKDEGSRRRKKFAVANNSKTCSLSDLSWRVRSLTEGKVLIGYGLEFTPVALGAQEESE